MSKIWLSTGAVSISILFFVGGLLLGSIGTQIPEKIVEVPVVLEVRCL